MLCHALEVVQGFIVDATLGMAAVISGVAVAAALPPRGCAEETFTLFQFIQPEFEEAGPLAIHQRHPQTRLCSEQQGEGLQMELMIHEELSSVMLWGQIKFSPKIAAAAGKHRPGAGLVAVQALRQFEDAMQVGPGAPFLPFFSASRRARPTRSFARIVSSRCDLFCGVLGSK